jgi:hypothetical protein
MPKSKKDTLRQILGSDTTQIDVHGEALLDVLSTAADDDEAVELLTTVILERDSVEKKPTVLSNKGLSVDAWDELARSHSRLIREYLQTAFFSTNSAEEFSKKILDFMKLFPNNPERTFVFSAIIFGTPYIPYKQLPGKISTMTQHVFDHIISSNPEKRDLVRYVSGIPFSTTVEHAGMVLQVIDDVQDRDTRLALLALAFAAYRDKIRDILREADD